VDELFEEVLIVTNSPNGYADIPCRKVTDLHVNRGVLAGIHSGLCHSRHARVFVVACDMPFINPLVVRAICTSSVAADVVIPSQTVGLEPLHAIYAKSCIKAITDQLDAGEKRITSFFLKVCVRELGSEYWQGVDPQGLSFCNINTPNEYFRLRCEAEDQKFVQEGQQACSGDRLP
jgi:FdhD protein